MIFFIIISLGFYYFFWCLKRFLEINKVSKEKIVSRSFIIFNIIIILLFFLELILIISNQGAYNLLSIITAYSALLLAFKIKYSIIDYCYYYKKNEYPVYISKWLTYFFTIFYLQYKINTIIDFDRYEEKK
jgi:hypothetical protein